MASVSIKMTETYHYLAGYPRLPGGFIGDRDYQSLAVTQDGIISSAAAEESVGLWLPTPKGLRNFPVKEELATLAYLDEVEQNSQYNGSR